MENEFIDDGTTNELPNVCTLLVMEKRIGVGRHQSRVKTLHPKRRANANGHGG